MNKKTAFTLSELLIVFLIIGIVASVGMMTVRPWEKGYKYSYTRIFNALSIAIYNHMATEAGSEAFPSTPEKFCNALISYINTSNNAQNESEVNPCNLSDGQNSYLGNNPTRADFVDGGKFPKIRLSSGAKLWIGANDGAPFSYTQEINSTPIDVVRYYIVYADINGDVGPNNTEYTKSGGLDKLPDIVAFIVTDNFTVIPVGYPKVDQRYLTAHILYPATEEDDEAGLEKDKVSDGMTYYEALVGAYGASPNKIVTLGVQRTYDIENSLPEDSKFKLTDVSKLNEYTNNPHFDSVVCGDGDDLQTIIANGTDSHCDIKIYNYN